MLIATKTVCLFYWKLNLPRYRFQYNMSSIIGVFFYHLIVRHHEFNLNHTFQQDFFTNIKFVLIRKL